MRDILDIIKNIETIYTNNSSLSVLKDFERVLDDMDLYVYDNWMDGEIVEGPIVSRHWVKASFMWPKDHMPDPMGGKRLLDYGCKVEYEKTNVVKPRKIKSPKDYRPGTMKGKLDKEPVWVVHITMPKELVSDVYDGHMTAMKNELGIGRNNKVDHSEAQSEDITQQGLQPPAQPQPQAPLPAGDINAIPQ